MIGHAVTATITIAAGAHSIQPSRRSARFPSLNADLVFRAGTSAGFSATVVTPSPRKLAAGKPRRLASSAPEQCSMVRAQARSRQNSLRLQGLLQLIAQPAGRLLW